MDRRQFIKIAETGVVMLAVSNRTYAAMSGMGREEIEKRVEELLSRMSLEEKIEQMSGQGSLIKMIRDYSAQTYNSGENQRLGIPAIRFTDGPRGVMLNRSTCFPCPSARGATWDVELEERVGEVIGYESRAQGANFFGGVCINLLRHPGWGRAQETYGEDPHLLGEMGSAMVRGAQKHVMACAKHFSANSIEDSRFYVDVRMDERTLREVYLPHFKRCVDQGAAAIMSAYNDVNGHLCSQNPHLLRDILKGDWGFEGIVVSDFVFGVKNAAAAANAGLDIEMPCTRHFGRRLKRAVRSGKVQESVIDEAVTRVLRMKMRFGLFEEAKPCDESKVACKEHTELALEAARKSIVLLKNRDRLLPLDRGRVKKLAVIGRLADMRNLGDKGSSNVTPPYAVTPLEGIRSKASRDAQVVYEDGKDVEAAKSAAKGADVAVVVAGLTFKDEGEGGSIMGFRLPMGGDREELGLRGHDQELINAVAGENPRCIVVLEGGSAITMESWKDGVPAILMAWYPGMEGGAAIAEIIFGDVNPCAKLPVSIPRSEDQLVEFDTRSKEVQYGFLHGYRHLEKNGLEPALPFGFGLSYTEYGYANLRLEDKDVGRGGKVKASVDVFNKGQRAGEEVVQLYVGCKDSKVMRAPKVLKGFARVSLGPGQTGTVTIELPVSELAYYNRDAGEWQVEETEYIVYAGPSSRDQELLSEGFEVKGD